MLMETLTYPHFPSEVSKVHLALYCDVSNAVEIRKRLVTAATLAGEEGEHEREAVNYAFVDATLITSRLHVQTAIYQAILACVQGSLRTKTIHSEVLWALSPGHNISEAIRRFGVSDTDRSLLVIRVSPPSYPAHHFETRVGLVVKGELHPLSSLERVTNWALVRKYYKLNVDPVVQVIRPRSPEEERALRALTDQLVVSAISMKSVSA